MRCARALSRGSRSAGDYPRHSKWCWCFRPIRREQCERSIERSSSERADASNSGISRGTRHFARAQYWIVDGARRHCRVSRRRCSTPDRLGSSRCSAFYADPEIGGVGGFVDHPGHYNPVRNTAYRLLGLTSNRYRIDWGGFNLGPASHPTHDQPAAWLSGGNMSFRRNAVQTIGGFDEALGSFWHEDVDLAHRVTKSGWKMISTARMAIDHYPNTINRPPLHLRCASVSDRESVRVEGIGDEPLWRVRYGARLFLHAAAMGVVGLAKLDPRIPLNVLRGGLEGMQGSRYCPRRQCRSRGDPVMLAEGENEQCRSRSLFPTSTGSGHSKQCGLRTSCIRMSRESS